MFDVLMFDAVLFSHWYNSGRTILVPDALDPSPQRIVGVDGRHRASRWRLSARHELPDTAIHASHTHRRARESNCGGYLRLDRRCSRQDLISSCPQALRALTRELATEAIHPRCLPLNADTSSTQIHDVQRRVGPAFSPLQRTGWRTSQTRRLRELDCGASGSLLVFYESSPLTCCGMRSSRLSGNFCVGIGRLSARRTAEHSSAS
jgi:hypothetical protein